MVIVFAAICFRLGHLPLLAPDEGRNAEVGREMKESGAWLVPTYNGVDYLDKPAFYFKTVALSLAIFGQNETAARIPSAAFGVGLVVMVLAFCRKVHGTRCGLLAAIVVATTPLYFVNARIVIFDIALAFFVCGAIFAGYLAEATPGKAGRTWYLLGAASAGFATLVKGPVGFLIPALVLMFFNRLEGRTGAWKRLFAPLNLVVFFGITLPWFVGLCFAHRDFFHYGLVEESFNRFTTARKFHRSESFYFYLPIIAGLFFPWSLLLPEASVATWKERWAKHPADRLCVLWSAVVIVFFSLSQSKLPGYILSVTVACGILLARLLEAALTAPEGKAARILARGTAVFALLCLLVAMVAVLGASQVQLVAKPLRITVVEAKQLGQGAGPLALLLAGFSAFAMLARYRHSASLCILCLAAFPPLLIHLSVGVLDAVFDAKSGRRIARQLSGLPEKTELACLECFPNGLPFYLKRTATLISRDGHELTSNYIISSLEKGRPWPGQIVPLADFDGWLASRKAPVCLIVRREDCERVKTIAAVRGTTVQALSPAFLVAQLPAPGGP
ncbi:MAG TPA: glycosyltransferase family 39 protein [Candidatus Acidoferrum sp.]|jgi:4-amino-4-deoxy-L-arabinose transferase-like glycosyltransferase|nr:glycosyltransferase family 39 protein [Candidatus Acidoferrum sp.]